MNNKLRAAISLITVYFLLFFIIYYDDNSFSITESLYEIESHIIGPYIDSSSIKGYLGYTNIGTLSEILKKNPFDFIKRTLLNSPLALKSIVNFEKNQLPIIYIDVPFKSLATLNKERVFAKSQGILTNKSWVKAKIIYDGIEHIIKIRLKGDLSDHWRSSIRYSLDVKLKGKSSILNQTRFAIQQPLTRQYPYSPIFSAFSKKLNFLHSKHSQVHVFFNGHDWGIMDMEERISSAYLEKQKKKDSLVVAFGKDEIYLQNVSNNSNKKINNDNYYGREKFFLDINHGKFIDNPELLSWVVHEFYNNHSKNLLTKREQTVEMLALALLWGNAHHSSPTSIQYYLNPYDLYLEPIIGDVDPPSALEKMTMEDIRFILFDFHCFCNWIDRLSLFKDAVALINSGLGKELVLLAKTTANQINRIFPSDAAYDLSILEKNINFLERFSSEELLGKIEYKNDVFIKNNEAIDIQDITILPWSDKKVSIINNTNQKLFIRNFSSDMGTSTQENIELDKSDLENVSAVTFSLEGEVNHSERISYSLDLNGKKINGVMEYPLLRRPKEALHSINNCKDNLVDSKKEILSGNIIVDKPLIYYSGLTLKKGTTIKLLNHGSILVCGTFESLGSNELPVRIIGYDGNNGILINAKNSNINILFTELSNLAAYNDDLIKLTGGLNLYNGMVTIKQLFINNSNSEDALNIIQSEINIDGINIANTISDAIDFDFINGEARSITLSNIMGDALDFSGSDIFLSHISCKDINDKCISAGEASNIRLENLNSKNSGVVIASKDGSAVFAEHVSSENAILAPALSYNKKTFYSPAKLNIHGFYSEDKRSGFEGKSTLIIDGKLLGQKYSTEEIEQEYSSGIMKK